MCGVNKEGDKMMERGIFEEVEGLSIVSISDINFAYNTNREGYTTLSSDIPKLYAIVSKRPNTTDL